MYSIWSREADMPQFPPLEGDTGTDVLVIGGGLAGVLCAYYLRQAGVDCLLLEAETIGGGVTLGTTAKITAQHGLMAGPLIRALGQDRARLFVRANLDAVEEYRRLCAGLGCDLETADSYVYSRDDRELIQREVDDLHRLGCPASFQRDLELPFPVAGAAKVPDQLQFHPLKFLAALARELNIREHTSVRAVGDLIQGERAVSTSRGTVRAKRVIVATHFPFLDRFGGYFLKLYQDRSYVIALEYAPQLAGMYRDADERGLSLRSAGPYLLLGGNGGRRTGRPSQGWRPLRETAHRYWPDAKTAAFWATQDCMTLDGVPYVGLYGKNTEGLYVAAGFQKWGMTSAMAAAQILTAMLTGREHPAQAVCSPQRTMPLPALAANGMEAAADLAFPTLRRCPHLGCALRWNKAERTWDCPCHGSRFTRDGRLLDGPAQEGLD